MSGIIIHVTSVEQFPVRELRLSVVEHGRADSWS